MRLNHAVIENKAIGDVAYPSSNCYEFIKALKASTDMVADIYVDGKHLATSGVRFTIKDDWLCGRVSFRFSLASSRIASIVVVKVYKAGYRESTITLSSMAMVSECIDSGDQQAELQFVVMSVVPYNSRRAPRLKSSITPLKSSLLEPVNFEDLPADDTIEVEPDIGADYDLGEGRVLHVGASANNNDPLQIVGKSVSIRSSKNGRIDIVYDGVPTDDISSEDGTFTAEMLNEALLDLEGGDQIEFSGGPIVLDDLPIEMIINATVIIEHNLDSVRGLESYDFGGINYNNHSAVWNTSEPLIVNLQFNSDTQITGVNMSVSNGDGYSKPMTVIEGDGNWWSIEEPLTAESVKDLGTFKLILTAEALYANEGGDHPITGDPVVTLNFTENKDCSYIYDTEEVQSLVWNTSNPIDFWIQLNEYPAQDIPVVSFDGIHAIQRDTESDQPDDGLYHFIITRDQLPEPPEDGDIYNVGFSWASDMASQDGKAKLRNNGLIVEAINAGEKYNGTIYVTDYDFMHAVRIKVVMMDNSAPSCDIYYEDGDDVIVVPDGTYLSLTKDGEKINYYTVTGSLSLSDISSYNEIEITSGAGDVDEPLSYTQVHSNLSDIENPLLQVKCGRPTNGNTTIEITFRNNGGEVTASNTVPNKSIENGLTASLLNAATVTSSSGRLANMTSAGNSISPLLRFDGKDLDGIFSEDNNYHEIPCTNGRYSRSITLEVAPFDGTVSTEYNGMVDCTSGATLDEILPQDETLIDVTIYPNASVSSISATVNGNLIECDNYGEWVLRVPVNDNDDSISIEIHTTA